MSTIGLQTPYLEDGIRSVNFFNGRVLSGEDMVEEQQARRLALLRLGRASGAGVAYGLEVTGTVGAGTAGTSDVPKVTVAPGLAVNRMGEALEILNPIDVSLLPAAGGGAGGAAAAGDGDGDFGACGPVSTSYVAGEGVFLLVISPASGREGQAIVGGLGGSGGSGSLGSAGLRQSCNARSNVEGVKFKLLRLDVTDFSDAARLRNQVAHLCFGTGAPALDAAVADPFGASSASSDGYGLIDALRDGRLTDCDVPLAVIHWKDPQGIRFIDRWSARRRLVRAPSPAAPPLSASAVDLAPLVGDRRAAEGEAMLMQFQEEAAEIGMAGLGALVAADRFKFLPPIGMLPHSGVIGAPGVRLATFFSGFTVRDPVFVIEGSRVASLFQLALRFPAIDPSKRELVWLYQVRENLSPRPDGSNRQPAVIFVNGQVPYYGDARLDVAHVSFGNFVIS